ncbi:MAG: amidohydrolase [Acidobacteria bacterium]|nr:MAG: amidohydrolase [Acidobacteriota bacterium]
MKKRLVPVLLPLALIACAPEEKPPPADLVLFGGTILTLEEAQPEASALAARDGRIVAVGDRAAVEPLIGDGTEVIDLAGATAIPGFIEGHGHFMGIGDAQIQLDLRAARRWQEIVDQVAAAVAEAAPGEWIRGRGWHQDKWDEPPSPAVEGFPVHDSLSAVSPDNPVILTHASGHASFVNAKAMTLAGIDRTTPDPPGGEILRDRRGRPTGLLRETAAGLVQRARSQDGAPPAGEARRMIELASAECLRNGITSFQDAGSPFPVIDLLKQAADDGLLGVRLWIMVRDSNDELRAKLAGYKVAGYAGGMLSVGGIKLSIDGALGSRGAWLLEPYDDAPHTSGLNLIPLESARETAEIAIDHGVQLCIHAIGDRANREVLNLYQETFAAHPDKRDLRWRIEHAQHLHPDDVPRFAELGVIASVQAIHCTSDAPWVPDRIGERRAAEGAYVWRKLLDSGAVLINGTDAPVEPVSPIGSFYAAVSRRLADGTRFYPEQRMTRQEALESYTKNAAWAVFEEDDKGTLAPGKLADVTVLSQNLLTVAEEDIPRTEVLYTIVGGRVAYRRP